MSKLEELLQGVDVEWKAINDIIKVITAPCKVKKEIYKPIGKTPIIDQGKEYIAGYTDENFETVIADEYILFGDHSEHIKYVNFSFIQGADGLKILKIKKDFPKYIYYCFLNFYNKEYSYKRHWTNAKNTLIPIPCPDNPEKSLEIQQEIVRVLDELTSLTNQLTTELETERQNRKKQFEFFREQLFRFEGKELEWNKLGSVADVTKLAGYEFTKHIKYSDEGNIIALRGLNVKGTLDLTNVKYIDGSEFTKLSRSKLYINDMLFTYVGTIGEIALINENDKYYLAPNVSRIRFENSKLLPSFMFYYFKTDFFVRNQINKYLSNSSMKNLTMENIRKFMVPIPPLEEQERIVKLLNQFDATHTAIEEEITKEIKLRTQQYEYYREKLLSFPSLRTT
ncbi:restriction endonuclease subunit S [Empedobacter sp.]|uniref:restriction endonuclease subunit S n=1 Tax=Empedobacter sp. TaxID=1927715 RepID=UPI0028ADB740|nr:restriction endonuclease subunit S [Empedobacter sp.]